MKSNDFSRLSSRIIRFIAVLVVFSAGICLTLPAFALSDAEYRKMVKNPAFARADKALNTAWSEAKSSLDSYYFDILKKDQQQWVSRGRDAEAKVLMNRNGLSRVDAYARVTLSRAEAIQRYVQENASSYDTFVNSVTKNADRISKGKHTDQEAALRAWRGKDYLLIREYEGKKSYLANFWVATPQMTFANGLKVGSSLSELENFFGEEGRSYNDTYYVGANKQWVEFEMRNNRVLAIHFVQSDCQLTPKMERLLNSYMGR